MTIPSWPDFPLANPASGEAIDGAKVDQAFGHLYAYKALTPSEGRSSTSAWTLSANDLNTMWDYEGASNVTWTIPAGLNPPQQVLIDSDGTPVTAEGTLWLKIVQISTGQVTLAFGDGLTVVKQSSLSTVRTDGVGTGLFVEYRQNSKARVCVWAF
jgi:hypothetical protein